MAVNQSSWKVANWVTPSTQVTVDPIDASVSPESRSKVSDRIEEQIPQFIRDDYGDFITFLKYYYKGLELKGNPVDIVQNIDEYYNIDKLNDLVESTTASSNVTLTSDVIDVGNTRDFPKEGLILIDEEVIYYSSKSQTQFKGCVRGFHATTKVGTLKEYTFSTSVAGTHDFGATVVNLNNLVPLFLLQRFRDQFAASFPSKFDDKVRQSSVTKRLKDFYASKGTSRSFKYLMRVLFGVESTIEYPKDRIFKPSDAFYTVREVIRATAISGNPVELTGEVLYQADDPNDPNVLPARIYVKSVVEVFTEDGKIYELDVDTENGAGNFTTPYKTTLSEDLSSNLSDQIVTVDSTIGWPEKDGAFRINNEIIEYKEKTVTQFLNCTRARQDTSNQPHIAGSEVVSAFEIYGYSNRDQSKISLKVYGGTRGVDLVTGGRYYLQDSKVTTPAAPGFDSLDPLWNSFVYNVKKLLNGTQAVLATPAADGSVVATITTDQNHGLKRDDTVRILNAPEDVYNTSFIVQGVGTLTTFDIKIPTTPIAGVTDTFLITREYAKSTSSDTSIRMGIEDTPADIQNVYRSTENAIIASPGVPGHEIGPFGADDLDPGNQRYLKRIPLTTTTKSTKTETPIGQVGIGVNGVPFFSYKTNKVKLYGGIKSITVLEKGDGYDITNPPIVEFEPLWFPGTAFGLNRRIRNSIGYRYKNIGSGKTAELGSEPTHVDSSLVQDGSCIWQYEGLTAEATVGVSGSVYAINVTNGGSGYTTTPTVAIIDQATGANMATVEASAIATVTNGKVNAITVSASGTGYTDVPIVTISGGGGVGATAEAVVRGGIGSVAVSNPGSNYDERPNVSLISGSGAVAYPSIVGGRIVSIILTYGGGNYYGPPDVVITGDGVGAVAFATIDSVSKQVTSVSVTNGGIGYTAGKTFVDIVYPGSGAKFQVELPSLSINEAATPEELGVTTNELEPPKTADLHNGVSVTGANYGIYGGEYGYLYNPRKLRFLLGDNVSDVDNSELNPTRHSPILGWSYDGHPIYGPYGFVDRENKNPYNQFKLMVSSYRVKSSRDALITGLTDTMGKYVEDYEYVEGLGDLDQYNGRFCVTPEYPLGVYAYFCTIDGTTGNPKFPYFIGPNFYSEADEVNWKGNGLQQNFTEDASRFKAPYIYTDTSIVRRKELGDPVEYVLALEDATTPIVLESDTNSSQFIGFVDVGIGYYDYFPTVKGGAVDSLYVSATNRYFSSGLDEYLIEGPGFDYKVNDRLVFNEEGTGGSGISARVSRIAGSTTNALTYSVDSTTDIITGTVTTGDAHYIKPGEVIDITIGDNAHTRDIKVKSVTTNSIDYYHFKYFDLTNFYISSPGRVVQANLTLTGGDNYTNGTYNGIILTGGSGSECSADITVSGNAITSVSIQGEGKNYKDGDVLTCPRESIGGTGTGWSVDIGNVKKTAGIVQGFWTFFAGTGGTPGTYTRVPLKNASTSSGEGAEFTIVVGSGGGVESVTVTKEGSGYYPGEQLDPVSTDIGGCTGFYLTPNAVNQEFTGRGDASHQLSIGDEIVVSNTNPSEYDGTHTITGYTTERRFQFKKPVGIITDTAIPTQTEVYVKEAKLDLINGHYYKFDTSDSSNNGKRLEFTFDKENTNVFTYKNVTDFENDLQTGEQQSITISLIDVPGTLFYFDINGVNGGAGSYLSVVNDPYLGQNTIVTVPSTTLMTFTLAREPETGYTANNLLSYATNSIFPSGGISAINIGDPGRNYSTIPQFTGIERAGGGAEAVCTISGVVEDVAVLENGIDYNGSNPPAVICSMPDFVDLTIEQVFGTFAKGDIVISKPTLDTSTARGKVISWNANTSILRVQPLRNNLQGTANRGFIMFTSGTAATNKVIAGSNQAVINDVSGAAAQVAAVVPSSGPQIGMLTVMAVNSGGSNYREAPEVFIDDPWYGGVLTVSINSQNASANFTAGTYTGVTQESVAPTGGDNAEFTIVIDASSQDVSSATVTTGGNSYALGDLITINGEKITGGGSADDFVLKVESLTYVRKAVTSTTINASIDEVIVTNTGSGFLSAPEVIISGGTGLNATLRAEIIDETVNSVVIENAGTKFQNPPIITIQQGTGKGASILLKSSDLGKVINLGGDNITYNYSHDRTLKPAVNTTYNLQLTRTQIVDFFTVTDGGYSFVTKPTIELVGGGGSGASLDAIIDNEVIQAIEVINPGKGYSSTPAVQARMTHNFVPLQSNSTLNFPYNTKIPLGTEVQLIEIDGTLPAPLVANTTYYAVAATISNGMADNQIKLATTKVNAIDGTTITITGQPTIGPGGTSTFNLTTTDLGDTITVTMKPATFSIGEKLYQGTSTDSFSATGTVKSWDSKGRILSVEIETGEFLVGQPVFGNQTKAFGEIHEFDRSQANFKVSPIATATAEFKRTTGILDLNEQRIYDSNRYQEFSYVVNSPINIKEWKNQFKTSAHPAGFKVLGTQVVSQSAFKRYRSKSFYNPANPSPTDWWEERFGPEDQSFNGTTYFTPKPSASNSGKLSRIENFFLGKPDYTAAVPTNVQVSGKQLLDVRKILTSVVDKFDKIESRTFSFDGSSSSVVSTANDQISITNHGLLTGQKINYSILADRYQDARDLIIANIDHIVNTTSTWLEAQYPNLTDGSNLDYNSATCKRDLRLVVVNWCNDLRYGGNSFSWDVVDQYIGGVGVLGNKYADAKFLIRKNTQLIAEEALGLMKADYPAFSVHNGSDQDCYDDIKDILNAIGYNMTYGGNSEVYDGAKYYVDGNHVDSVETEVNVCLNYARDLAIKVAQNYPLVLNHTSEKQFFDTTITHDVDGYINNQVADARNLILSNKNQIAETAVDRMETQYPSHAVTGGRIECEYDIRDFIDAMVENLARGGNDQVWDAANYYVTGGFVIGEETESAYAFEQAKLITQAVSVNSTVADMTGQVKDNSITTSTDNPLCTDVQNSIVTLYDIVINAITTPLNHQNVTRTAKTGGNRGSCALVESAITTNMAIITTAIANDNLNHVTRTEPANAIYHVAGEETETIAAIQYARDLTKQAVQNLLPVTDNTITVDSNSCTDVQAAVDTLAEIVWRGIDNPSSVPDRNVGNYPNIRVGDPVDGYTEHGATNAVYLPASGLFTVTVADHGFELGEYVQFEDETFILTCSKDSHATEHKYPRSTDPASGKWLEIIKLTKDSFTVNVGITTDTSTHKYVAATGTHTFVSGVTNAITDNTTATHTAASGTTYNPVTGDMVIEIGSHSLTTANTITIANSGIVFSCDKDNYATNHAYPRATDPVSGQTLSISAVTATTITVNVTPATKIRRRISDADNYYVIRVDADNFKIAQSKSRALAGYPIELTGLSTSSQHKLKLAFDAETTDFQLRYRTTPVAPTNKNMLMVVINGLVQNPESYSISGSTITFAEAPMADSECIIMYYKRSNIATNFQLDQFGDVIATLNTTTGLYQGSGYTAGTYNGVPFINKRGNTGTGATGNVTVTNVLDSATHNINNQYADARDLIDNNTEIIADIAVGLMNKYGIAVDNRVADGANLILMNKDLIAKEAVERMHADIPYTIPSSRELDAYNLIQGNRDLLAWEAYHLFSTIDYPGYTHAQGYTTQDCIDDVLDIIDAVSFNLLHGANNKVYDAAYFYTQGYAGGSVISGEEQQTLAVLGHLKTLMNDVVVNKLITIQGSHGYEQYTENTTYIFDGCANVLSAISSLLTIIETAINTDLMVHVTKTEPTLFVEPTGDSQDCVDDVVDCLEAIALNLKFGGNSEVYDAANYYVQGAHVAGEEIHTIYAFRVANELAQMCARQKAIQITGTHGLAQKYDGGLTRIDPGDPCASVCATIDTLWNIVEVAVNTNSMSTFTRTAPTGFTVPGLGPDQCKSDTVDILEAVGVNIAFGGNHVLWDTLNLLLTGAHLSGEEAETRYVFEEARQMVLKAVNNESFDTYAHLNLTDKQQFKDPTITAYSTTQTPSFTPTAATYNAANGNLELTIGSHTLTVGSRIQIDDASLTFKCEMDGSVTHHSYPKSYDFAFGKSIPITAVAATSITVNVGKTPQVLFDVLDGDYNPLTGHLKLNIVNTSFNVSTGTYNPTSGVMTLTIGNHSMQVGEHVMFKPGSLKFTCAMDEHSTVHSYPRVSDPFYNEPLRITARTSTTITVNVGKSPELTHDVTDGTYDPATGDMTLTIGNHLLVVGQTVELTTSGLQFQCAMDNYATDHAYPRSTIDTHTASGATFNTTTGVVSITVNSHGMRDGDWVKLADSSLTFTCTHGGGTHAYPRPSDPISGKWVKIFGCTADTFDIQCLENTPCTNATVHTFVSATTNGIEQKKDRSYQNAIEITAKTDTTITINVGQSSDTSTHRWKPGYTAGNAVVSGGAHTTTFKSADAGAVFLPHGMRPQKVLTVETADYNPTTGIMTVNIPDHGLTDTDQIKIKDNSLVFECPAATGTHAFVSGVSSAITPNAGSAVTAAAGTTYNPTTGDMIIEIGSHSLTTSNTVQIAAGAVTFTCDADNNGSNHAYPRATDPVLGQDVAISAVTGTTITVNVGIASTTNQSSYPRRTDPVSQQWTSITDVTRDSFKVQVLDSAPSTNVQAHTFISALGYGITVKGATVKLADSSITMTCAMDDHFTDHAYPRTGTITHTVTDASYVASKGFLTCTVNNHGMRNGDFVKFADNSLTFSCQAAVGTHTYTGGTVSNAITITAGSVQKDVTNATYNPTNGLLELTIGSHSFTTSDTVTIGADKIVFSCDADNHATNHAYPRSSDPAYNTAIAITAVSGTTITCNVGIASATTNNQDSYPRATDEASGSWIEIYNVTDNTFSCTVADKPANQSAHTFVSATSGGLTQKIDSAYDSALQVVEATHDTITLNVGASPTVNYTPTNATYNAGTGAMELTIGNHNLRTGTTVMLKEGAVTFTCDEDADATNHAYPRSTIDGYKASAVAYNPTTGIMSITSNGHSLLNGDWIKLAPNSFNFTCTHGDSPNHTYPRVTDPFYDKWIQVSNVSANAFDVQVLATQPSTNTTTHSWVAPSGMTPTDASYSGTTGIMTLTVANHGLSNGDMVKLDDGAVTLKCDYGSGVHTWQGGTATNAFTVTGGAQMNVTGATYDSSTGDLEMTIGAHSLTTSNTITFAANALTFSCELDSHATNHTYPRATDPVYGIAIPITTYDVETITVNVGNTQGSGTAYPRATRAEYTAGAGSTYDPATGLMVITTTVNHAINVGDEVLFDDNAVKFSCGFGGASGAAAQKDYPRASDYASGKWLKVHAKTSNTFTVQVLDTIPSTNTDAHTFVSGVANAINVRDPLSGRFVEISNVTANTFDIQCLDTVPSTNTSNHTFVSAAANSVQRAEVTAKRDKSYNHAVNITGTSATTITLDVGVSSHVSTHAFVSALTDGVITGGNHAHKFKSATSGAVIAGGNYTHTFLSAKAGAVLNGQWGCTHVQASVDTLMDLAYTVLDQNSFSGLTRTVGNNGDGYETAPTITVTGGSPTTNGIMSPVLSKEGYIKSITVLEAGVGYANAPTVRITSNTGSGATATANVSGNAVTSISVTEGGYGYDDVTVELIANPSDTITTTATAFATVGRYLDKIVVQETGKGYATVPSLSISGGSPSTAASGAVALLTGAVTDVTLVSGGDGYKNTDMLGVDASNIGGTVTNSFQVEVDTVTFNGVTTAFAATVSGTGYTLPANDRFLLFLNSTLQKVTESYTYTGTPSTITFTEAPLGNMDFYCFYVGQLQDMDDLAPFFNGNKKTFILKKNDQPFSLESDSTDVITANNLVMFLNGIYQEPEVAFTLNGSILEFSEAPRAGSDVQVYIYTGSSLDIATEDTYSCIDPGDILEIESEGEARKLATIASSSSLDTYEYTGLRPTVAEFTATVVGGKVVDVTIVNPGSNYEVAPYLLFNGGGGSGAYAQTIVEQGSGKVIGIKNLQGGSNYNTTPAVTPYHPIALERTQRDRAVSNGIFLYTTHLDAAINATDTTINVVDAYYNGGIGFPSQGEILIPYWNSTGQVWGAERILYGSVDYNTNQFTVTTNGRGWKRTGPSLGVGHAISIETGTYTSVNTTTDAKYPKSKVTATMGANHNLQTGMERYIQFTSGLGSYPATSLNTSYKITKTADNQFEFEIPVNLAVSGQSLQILPTVRVYTV